MSDFTLPTSTQEPDLDTAMKVVYQWDYGSSVDELRRLYVKAAESAVGRGARRRLGPAHRHAQF